MVNNKADSLLLIAFERRLIEQVIEDLSPCCDIDIIDSMDVLEGATINPGAVIYIMDISNSIHLYHIHFIRNKYPNKQFFVITRSVSIPLLQQSIRAGVNDLFILPLSGQDKQVLFDKLQNKTAVDCVCDEIEGNRALSRIQIKKPHPIAPLFDIIEQDYAKGPSLQDLSNTIHLSPSRICHLFKDICGITYSSYLLCRKIEEGERLLTLAVDSVTTISYQLGFANPSHFCRSFKEHFNITPSAYASGTTDANQSVTYLRYQKLRFELLPNLETNAYEKTMPLLSKRSAS